jgi:hypothetical protein
VPERVTALTTPPAERPNSDEYALVNTWNSRIASTPSRTPADDPGDLLYTLLMSVPSRRKLFCSGRAPLIEIFGERPPTTSFPAASAGVTPVWSKASC